jgi:hypothetical protein
VHQSYPLTRADGSPAGSIDLLIEFSPGHSLQESPTSGPRTHAGEPRSTPTAGAAVAADASGGSSAQAQTQALPAVLSVSPPSQPREPPSASSAQTTSQGPVPTATVIGAAGPVSSVGSLSTSLESHVCRVWL